MTVADMSIQVEAARLLIHRAAANAEHGLPVPYEVSVAKCYANEMAKRVSDLAMQLHGGNGYTTERQVGIHADLRIHRNQNILLNERLEPCALDADAITTTQFGVPPREDAHGAAAAGVL